jgi:hypothetical protein
MRQVRALLLLLFLLTWGGRAMHYIRSPPIHPALSSHHQQAGAPIRGAPPLFAAWQGSVGAADGVLGVPSVLAACLSLRPGALVQLVPLRGVPAAEAVIVEPLTGDDWEVIDLNAGHLEERMLEQVGLLGWALG